MVGCIRASRIGWIASVSSREDLGASRGKGHGTMTNSIISREKYVEAVGVRTGDVYPASWRNDSPAYRKVHQDGVTGCGWIRVVIIDDYRGGIFYDMVCVSCAG